MRVVIVGDPSTLNFTYRALQPAQALALGGHDVLVEAVEEKDLRAEALEGFDLVYVYRYSDRATRRIAQAARERGSALVWDNDDDLTSYPSKIVGSLRKGALRSQRASTSIAQMAQLADVVTTTTDHLAAGFSGAGASRVRVVENFVQREHLDPPRRAHTGVVVGWTAALEHLHDLRVLELRRTLQRLLDAHADLRVVSVGMGLELERERYERIDFVRSDELPAAMDEYDVGIAPLADVDFNRARSNIKVKEYAALGIPWLASPVGQYVGLGEQQGGRLVADDRWYEEIERLILSARDRRKLGKRAARWAKSQRIDANADRWVAAFTEALERRHAATAAV